MAITLNHTIVHAREPAATAAFLVDMFALPPSVRLRHFTVVQFGPTSLDLAQTDGEIAPRHFAFLVDEPAFDAILSRIAERALPFWADPFHREPGAINHWDDGRGVYFDDPNGHLLEAITRPYGSGGCEAKNPHPLLDCP